MTAPERRPAFESAGAAGRMCPFDYRYAPSVFRRTPDFAAETLYVVGGLYGNAAALETVEAMASAEDAPVEIVFNGDFHWFDAEPGWFRAVAQRVERYRALRGNVETEIARPGDIGAGCGCAYPDSVDEGIVLRSNDILAALRAMAATLQGERDSLARLPRHLVAQIGRLRVGIVHGDAWSLAGWRFAQDMLDDADRRSDFSRLRVESGIDIFASTHTCLAALRRFETADGTLSVVNNGAAGMPNFHGTTCGLITRIATRPSPHRPLYGFVQDGVHCDALPVHYENADFLSRFLARWPQGSAAHVSYFERIVRGPAYRVAQAQTAAMAPA